MTKAEKNWLFLTIVISIAWWGYLYGFTLGILFTFGLLFHEYGHYYWMGIEGIRDKNMSMMPPLGAIAVAHEPWPSMGAEARIALAGPGFGLISVIALLLATFIYPAYSLKIALFLLCYLNLFNLFLPVAVLDGGRVLKSILFSINKSLGFMFYYASFIFIALLVAYFMSLFTLFVGFFLFRMVQKDMLFVKYSLIRNSLKPMNLPEIFTSVICYAVISLGLYAVMSVYGIGMKEFLDYIRNNP